nr:zinc ribbon domain-containing protein [Anaerolineae bacterium]
MALKRIVCPSCGAGSFKHDEEGNLICESCGAKFASPREEIQCHTCGTLNPAQAERCMKCGGRLGRQCPVCGYINPPHADHCEKCATPLDTLSSIVSRMREASDGAVVDRTERLASSKTADSRFLAEQRALIEAEEKARLKRLAEQQSQHQRKQQRLVLVSLIVVGIILAIIVFAIILTSPLP